ncbi:MAG: hypothetical protein HOV83_37685 [Catenulispora sp.]|nr:hypothetical protein [Catenulispora sp.]
MRRDGDRRGGPSADRRASAVRPGRRRDPLDQWTALLSDPQWIASQRAADRSRDAYWRDGHFEYVARDPVAVPRIPEVAPWSPRPAESDRAGRTLFVILFWFALATSLELWWLDTPAGSLVAPADVWLAVGRITGLLGGFVLLLQVLLMSRVGWLERWIGAHALLTWHRELGAYVLLAVLVHVAATRCSSVRRSCPSCGAWRPPTGTWCSPRSAR